MCFADKNNADQELDEESAQGLKDVQREDAEIDAGVDEISGAIDRLHAVAGHMKEEVWEKPVVYCEYYSVLWD